MGDEIERRFFDAEDFSRFRQRLDEETALLQRYFAREAFSQRGDVAGFELEAWLVDAGGNPLPENERFLELLNSPLVLPELARFNIELNCSASSLSGHVFTRLHDELSATWRSCCRAAARLPGSLVTIGILPTVDEAMLSAAFMSSMIRYQSLNDRVMALRDGRPLEVRIDGDEPLATTHRDVMLEAAATSFQIHLQCRPQHAARDFNASLAVSAPMVAAAANSPFLFGHALWDETRIPLFEQSVDVGDRNLARVSFGTGYVRESLLEIFVENQTEHLILVPAVHDEAPNRFRHLRFHNGTIWRWNRPLIGFDFDGQAHLRIEHRVVPAGPTLRDCIANSAFYYGLIAGLRAWPTPIHQMLPFAVARDNFYAAARHGLQARIRWPAGEQLLEYGLRALISDVLLPLARRGLESLDIPASEIDACLGIVAQRVDSGQNGATWQRRWIATHGPDFPALVQTYRELQQQDRPVHGWPL